WFVCGCVCVCACCMLAPHPLRSVISLDALTCRFGPSDIQHFLWDGTLPVVCLPDTHTHIFTHRHTHTYTHTHTHTHTHTETHTHTHTYSLTGTQCQNADMW